MEPVAGPGSAAPSAPSAARDTAASSTTGSDSTWLASVQPSGVRRSVSRNEAVCRSSSSYGSESSNARMSATSSFVKSFPPPEPHPAGSERGNACRFRYPAPRSLPAHSGSSRPSQRPQEPVDDVVAGAGLRGGRRCLRARGPDRLRAALQQYDPVRRLAVQRGMTRVVAKQRPLDVLRDPVKLFHLAPNRGERARLVVGDAGRMPLAARHGLDQDPLAVRLKRMKTELCTDPPPGDLAGHLADGEGVRRHVPGHQGGAEAPGALDGHD